MTGLKEILRIYIEERLFIKYYMRTHLIYLKFRNMMAVREVLSHWLVQITLQIGLKKLLWLKNIKNTIPWKYFISDLDGEEIVGRFHEKELHKANRKVFKVKKVINRESNKLYAKWKGCDNFFSSWIDKKKTWYKWVNIFLNGAFGGKNESWTRFI